jgi:hypothetical protein
MNRIHVTAVLAFSTLVLPVSIACAQQIFGGGGTAPTSNQGSATGKSVPQCQGAPGGSRMRNRNSAECDAVAAAAAAEANTVKTEQQLNVTLDVPAPEALQCEASTETQYSQRNTVARVAATVSVANCSAGSTGTFTVVARVRDDSGETKPLEFAETWQRDDSKNVTFTNDYPIGENVELVNVRVRNLKCTCATAPEAASAAAETAPPN